LSAAFVFARTASITGSGTLTSAIAFSTFPAAVITGSGTLQGFYGIGRTASISGKATLQSYSISPQTPAFARTSSISGTATLLGNGAQPNLCECPEYLNLFPLTCGYVVDAFCTESAVFAGYDLPFTLPVFRIHLLATTISIGSGPTEYDVVDITNGQFEKTQTLVDTSTRDGSLVKTYKRMGCM